MTQRRSPAELSTLPIQTLRSIAAEYKLPLRRDMTIADIAQLISAHENSPASNIVKVADQNEPPAPGWARIEIHKDPSPGSSNADVYVGVNGYCVLIKRGVVVDVPIKILRGGLMDAKQEVMRENQSATNESERYYYEFVYAYPFTVHAITEGPDPRDSYEKAAQNKNRYKRQFYEERGYWPKPEALRNYIASLSNREHRSKE